MFVISASVSRLPGVDFHYLEGQSPSAASRLVHWRLGSDHVLGLTAVHRRGMTLL